MNREVPGPPSRAHAPQQRDDVATVASAGVLAATLAAFFHEAGVRVVARYN